MHKLYKQQHQLMSRRQIPYSGKFLRVQTFAKMPPEAPEELLQFLLQSPAQRSTNWAAKIFSGSIFAVVGSSMKTAEVCTM